MATNPSTGTMKKQGLSSPIKKKLIGDSNKAQRTFTTQGIIARSNSTLSEQIPDVFDSSNKIESILQRQPSYGKKVRRISETIGEENDNTKSNEIVIELPKI